MFTNQHNVENIQYFVKFFMYFDQIYAQKLKLGHLLPETEDWNEMNHFRPFSPKIAHEYSLCL